MKKILGLDLGTNSIGWALIQYDFENYAGKILGMGSRIIPMSKDILDNYDSGISISQTAERTRLRSTRRLRERHLLRRERIHRILNVLGFLPIHYRNKIDFDQRIGQFLPETETKLAYDNNDRFIFNESFLEMLADFQQHQPSLVADGKKVPYDWTIYYLRKKALTQKIKNEELAWLLLHFNQKRGYYQLRGEDNEDKQNKVEEFYSLKVVNVTAEEQQKGKSETWYNVMLENGWVYRRASKSPLFDWLNKTKDFIVTTELDEDGTTKKDKDGKEKRSFRAPKDDDWKLLKKKTEADIDKSNKTVGTYIYETLLQNPNQKIKGKLVRTIERKFYKTELQQILQKQVELNPVLKDQNLYQQCVEELYPHNAHHQSTLKGKDFVHLFIEDILYYQRPLRSQKSTISNCPLEARTFLLNGVIHKEPIKCIAKSHPLFQEFRLWQWIRNLQIYKRDDDQYPVTNQFLPDEDSYAQLFEYLNTKKEIDNKSLIAFLLKTLKLKGKALSEEIGKYRWNYVFDPISNESKSYPCNETHAMIISRLEKVDGTPVNMLTKSKEEELWHIIYSVTDKVDYEKALKAFAFKNQLDVNSFFEAFKRFPPFPASYGAYSAKAIKRLLPLMRTGKYWNETEIDEKTKKRIDKLINAEYDENIQERVREKAINLKDINSFKGLPEWLAKYIVYDRHAERSDTGRWRTITDMETYLKSFRQHSLKNPIVEQVLTEALRTVKDIWAFYGNGSENFFDEIHIELGREMKNTQEERKRLSAQAIKNEHTNLRIKALLREMANDTSVENVRPFSPMQQEILKIYEDGILNDEIDIPEDIAQISKMSQPTTTQLQRYKLWLEQKYRSPYTGDVIPLNKLFTPAYEIEHIIPQSRYFDDSLTNKVICEAAVNKLKDNQTGLEFIRNHQNEIVQAGMGKTTRILSEQTYIDFVKQHYAKTPSKRNKLLSLDIPEKMIARQLNDTRYISKFIMHILSNLVRKDKNDDGVNAKDVLALNGQITSKLKQDWGMDAIWNELILPRFERLNTISGTNHFTTYNERLQKYIPTVPLELQKGFQKKRIDHRHHAMDALVIACATRNHINYLNNQNALDKKKTANEKHRERFDLKVLLCDKKYNDNAADNYNWVFKQPWHSFLPEAKTELENTIVSFKQNLRVINKTVNHTETIINGMKEHQKQIKGKNWAIRKPLHKDTVSGQVALRRIKTVSLTSAFDDIENIVHKALKNHIKGLVEKGYNKKTLSKHFKENNNRFNGEAVDKVNLYFWEHDYVASRTPLNTSFNKARIESITDTGIQKILLTHLEQNGNNPDIAFSPEGIEEMNKNITALNNGKSHQPIFNVRCYEVKGNKFPVGQTGNKIHKYVEAAKGTNLFFAIYLDDSGKRSYETIPLNIVAERQKQGLSPVPEENDKRHKLLFYLSPNDLIYVDKHNEPFNPKTIANDIETECLYRVVSFTGNRLYGLPLSVATSIYNKNEFSPLNKLETTVYHKSLKETCFKINVDRIGKLKTIER